MHVAYDVVTFDCYGTLVDWRLGIVRAFEQAGLLAGDVTPDAILRLHAQIEPGVQREQYRAYRDVLRVTAQRMIERLGAADWGGDDGFLADSLSSWPVFADTAPTLGRLRHAGVQLGILSNIDDDLLAGTLSRIDIDFAFTVTAQQVRAYKPARAHFDAARSQIGQDRWLHAAQSYFHDIEPAHELGIPSAWVNRLGEPPSGEARPDIHVFDLTQLADRLVRG